MQVTLQEAALAIASVRSSVSPVPARDSETKRSKNSFKNHKTCSVTRVTFGSLRSRSPSLTLRTQNAL